MEIGDKLKCLKTINNILGWPLFVKDEIYNVLGIDGTEIYLNHNLYGNEYVSYPLRYVEENFVKL